ncbi:MAG TPA: glycosyltransferase family 9 protein, partial [Gemmatimonadaceae bacterium]
SVGEPKPPSLEVPASIQARVDTHLRELGVTEATTLVAMHPSARQEVRRWPLGRFAEVASTIEKIPNTRVLVFVDPDGYGETLAASGATCIRATVDELPAYLRRCAVFVGNDTGPAHIAAAVGVRTVTIFGPGAIDWFRPFGPGQRAVYLDPMPCRPCFDHCTQPTNVCLQSLPVELVLGAVREELDCHRMTASRVDGRPATSEIGG